MLAATWQGSTMVLDLKQKVIRGTDPARGNMPRDKRIDELGMFHHIKLRGIGRHSIFRNQTDRDDFLERFARIACETKTLCYAWALLPKEAHLLVRNGGTPVSVLMHRLLTGYAAGFNRRHGRQGVLFRDRYESTPFREENRLPEMVRDIHLMPLNAGIVPDMEMLDSYPYCGHGVILGDIEFPWQDRNHILAIFSSESPEAVSRYRSFIRSGFKKGCKPGRRQRPQIPALDTMLSEAAKIFQVPAKKITATGKEPAQVKARSIVAYWAVREFGMKGCEVGQKIGLSQSAVSRAVLRGEKLSEEYPLIF
jgi:hypothetical protein